MLILPFEWWMRSDLYTRLNNWVMAVIYSPLIMITAWLESRQAGRVRENRARGEPDDDTVEEWEEEQEDEDQEERQEEHQGEGGVGGGEAGDPTATASTSSPPGLCSYTTWVKRVRAAAPDVTSGAAVQEVRKLREEMGQLRGLLEEMASKS